MTASFRMALMCFLAALAGREALAADSHPLMAKPGKAILEDDFARSEMKPKWKVGKGLWAVKDGVVSAEEVPADKHGAYAYMDPNIAYKDVVAEFSFKLDGAKDLHLNLRDSNYKGSHAGHIGQVIISPIGVRLVDMKLGGMKMEYYEKTSDPKVDPAVKKEIQEKIKDKSAVFKIALDLTQWHQALVEVVGDEMLISIDGKPAGYIKSEGLDHASKNMLGFTVGGKSAEIKNVKFFEATANADWATGRTAVLASLKK